MPTTPTKKLAVLDLSHVWHAAWHVSENEELSQALKYTIRAVLRVSQNQHYDYFVCALDAPPYSRKEIYPQYKANREEKPLAMREQYRKLLHKLEKMGIMMWKAEGFEADDVIAAACKHGKAAGVDVTIYSADKDLTQLVGPNVDMVWTKTGAHMTSKEVEEKYGVPPHQIRDYLSLIGDTSDGMPNIPGIGPKTATKLLQQFKNLKTVLSHHDDIGGKVGETLLGHRKEILLNSVLVELQDFCPIPWSDIYSQDKPAKPLGDDRFDNELDPDGQLGSAPDFLGSDVERDAIVNEAADSLTAGARTIQKPDEAPVTPRPAPPVRAKAAEIEAKGVEVLDSSVLRTIPPEAPISAKGIVKSDPTRLAKPSGVGIALNSNTSMTADHFKLLEKMANHFHAGGIYQKQFDSPAAIFTVMALGIELGLTPQRSLMKFHMVEGKPCPSAQFLIGRAKADPNCEYFEMKEETPESVTYVTKQRAGLGREETFTYTMADARQAGLLNKNNAWKYHPRAMLRKTAGSQAARLWYPDSLEGLYSVEEMGHMPDAA